jgi:archaellum component FlaC
MSRAVDHIKDINDTKEIWKLAIKVDDIWTNVKSSKEYVEMIVRDIQVLQPSMLICLNNMLQFIRKRTNFIHHIIFFLG